MEYVKNFRILTVALTLALLVALVPATPALAVGDLRLTPNEGGIGDEIEAWGSGFEPGALRFYFSDERASVGDEIDTDVINYEYLGGKTASAEGYFQDFYFDVPNRLRDGDEVENVRGGTYYVYATDYYGEIQDRATFTVESVAEITLDPDEGTVGTEVEITGVGFGNREDITVEYDGDGVDIESGDQDTDSDGDFICTILIPESTAGVHTITVTGDDSDIEAEAEFTVEPKIIISPESGAPGATVAVSGAGFGERVNLEIFFNGKEISIASGDDETDNDGSFGSTFIVPALGAGTYDVGVEDDDGNLEEAEFTVGEANITISPTSGYAGTEVTVSGSGLQVSKSVNITFDNELVKTVSTDADGDFNTDFNVPVRITGTYKVKVSDGINTDEFDFAIITGASIIPETSAASPGHVGTELTVSGVGFIASRTVNITYDGNQVATATVNADGSFSSTFKVPATTGGTHAVVATDLTNTEQFTFTMESTPPSVVYPQLPLMGTKLEDWRFDWCGDATDLSKEVTDQSLPITYTLQIATSENFSEDSIVLEKTGLTESEYTLTGEERLESVSEETPYYWRVKAIDAASNEISWTGAGTFYVGFSWGISQPVIYILIGIGVLLLGILGFWLGRKTAYY